jgi:hypothetical protein
VPLVNRAIYGPNITVPPGVDYNFISPTCPPGYVATGSSFEGVAGLELVYSFLDKSMVTCNNVFL